MIFSGFSPHKTKLHILPTVPNSTTSIEIYAAQKGQSGQKEFTRNRKKNN